MAKKTKSFLPAPKLPEQLEWLWENETWRERFPALHELLAAGLFEGEPRKPATLTFFVSEGRLKAAIADRQTGLTMFLTLEVKGCVIDEVEAAVAAGKGEWRDSRKNGDKSAAPF